MVIILPHRGVPLDEVMRLFPTKSVAEIFTSLKVAAEEYVDDEVDVYLPRFKVTSDLVLNKVLTEVRKLFRFFFFTINVILVRLIKQKKK